MRHRFPGGGRDFRESEIVLSKVKAEAFLRDLDVQIMVLCSDTRMAGRINRLRQEQMQTALRGKRMYTKHDWTNADLYRPNYCQLEPKTVSLFISGTAVDMGLLTNIDVTKITAFV